MQLHNNKQKQELQISPNEAYKLDEEIKGLRRGTIMDFWKMVHKLGVAREYRTWVILGYESWETYLAQPEISYAPNTVNNYLETYISIYKYIKNQQDMLKSDILMLDPITFNFDITRGLLLKPYINDKLLEQAETLSYSDFLKEIETLKPQSEPLEKGVGKYQTIVIDPPWPVEFMKLEMRPNQVKMPYKTMPIKRIKNGDVKTLVQDLADENCNLFIWTTHSYLPDTFEILKAWDFKYHVCLTWDKTNGRSLFGFNRRTEFCLYAYKGKITVNQRGKFIDSIFVEKLREHSRKPDIFYQMIKNATPDQKRIDIFSREKREGFDQYGNEEEKFNGTT